MVDELRKEVPCREELLVEYEDLCRRIEVMRLRCWKGRRAIGGCHFAFNREIPLLIFSTR